MIKGVVVLDKLGTVIYYNSTDDNNFQVRTCQEKPKKITDATMSARELRRYIATHVKAAKEKKMPSKRP